MNQTHQDTQNVTPAVSKRRHRRLDKRIVRDHLATWLVSLGGICVIISVILICVFLVYVVLPLFGSATVTGLSDYQLQDTGDPIYQALDEYAENAVSIQATGQAVVFQAYSGEVVDRVQLLTEDIGLTAVDSLNTIEERLVFGLEDGRLLSVRVEYDVTYPDDVRQIRLAMTYPHGEKLIETNLDSLPIRALAVRDTEDRMLVATWQEGNMLSLLEYSQETSFLDDAQTLELEQSLPVKLPSSDVLWLGIDALYNWLYVVDKQSWVHFFDIRDLEDIKLVQSLDLMDYGAVSSATFLTGDLSLLLGFDSGRLIQSFPVRNTESNGYHLRVIREFPRLQQAITTITPEYSRKGFSATDRDGNLGVYYASNGEQVARIKLENPPSVVTFSPRENALLLNSGRGNISLLSIDNSYPEVSFSSLWSAIWYESYDTPDYIWQSSASTNDFEPKFSLAPLTFGTIKAAFYAMLVATPLAIMAAIYTAFFLSPALRQWVKPVIEIMEALPTVILGFLAGLWLAPFMEKNLTFIFLLLFIVPFGVLALGYGSTKIQRHDSSFLERIFSEEWRVVILLPTVLLLGYITWLLQTPLEMLFFGGDLRSWISHDLGISFDQRNALVVGTVMGFAVIPTIFSITEDAVFAVPKHLVNGSLALGASNWQTLVGVVLPTASPGIFSAVMIGMGRAVGETMIVLMATGNTPVMDFSIFEGMRTLSANIAVEMPEAEVGSSHYRILFLAGLVLFVFTFFFNTLGELVRQRLRKRYGSL